MGDLNVILSQDEKYGRRPFACSSTDPFRSFLDSFGMIDLGFSGNPFTWSNKRQNHHLLKNVWIVVLRTLNGSICFLILLFFIFLHKYLITILFFWTRLLLI
jgi:hypothetical protein